MKFDEYLAQYLYEKKSLHLQSIGTFELDKSVSVPQQSEKEIYYPIEGLSFQYNPKDVTNEDVISFLIKRLGKIEPLVRSDLDSYLSNIRQFINIGKPYTIEGIGTLHSNNQGNYEFTPGHFLPSKAEVPGRREKSEHFVRKETQKSSGGSRGLMITLIIVAVVVVLGAIGWAAYEFLIKPGREQKLAETEATVPASDTLPTADSSVSQNPASAVNTNTLIASSTDSVSYKMVFEITNLRQRANTRTAFLRSGGTRAKTDSIVTLNSKQYRMFIPMKLLSKDTLRAKDSLSKFFGRKVFITQ